MSDNLGKEIAVESAKAVAVEAYKDTAQPTLKAIGNIVSLPFRALDAALSKPKLWVEEKQYNFERTRQLLAEKLQDVPEELIVPPENYIAVPALQQIAYCYDSDELREMYANLLANSMNKVVKSGVHPGFVEIIKQLCPDEAKILRDVMMTEVIPIVTLRCTNEKGEGISVIKNFSNIGELSDCEEPYEVNRYFNNLIRLGLLEKSDSLSSLVDKTIYEPLKSHRHILPYIKQIEDRTDEYNKVDFDENYIYITDYGKKFCSICLGTTKIATAKIKIINDDK